MTRLTSAVFIFGILFFWSKDGLQAQQRELNCTQKLNQAEDMFDAGSLSGIPELLNGKRVKCFNKGGFSKEERIRAYRLLALVHLFNDNGPEAEDAVINLLIADPEHPLSPDDPIELKYLFDKYRSEPIFRIGAKVGANQTFIRSIGEFGSYSNVNEVSKEFKSGLGFQAELTFEYTIVGNLEVLGGLGWAQSKYDIGYNSITSLADVYPTSTNFVVSLTETQNQFKVPIMIRYGYPVGNLIPYATLGLSIDYLLNSTISGSRAGTATRQLTSLSLLDNQMRKEWNWAYFAGLGVKLKSKTNFFLFELRYNMAGGNTVRTKYRYNNQKLLFDMAHVDDDKIMNNLSVSFGYILSIYKPKKYSNKKLEKKFGKKKNKADE
ncbi:outer membrane beta-barrel protein [Reichenbachiella sp.]|uniref:outer membrane beta-barrel protein n=1 Tax=Reichenbachiella sp. TaxID=2184521 RepID=UPI003B5A5AF5